MGLFVAFVTFGLCIAALVYLILTIRDDMDMD